MKKEKITVTQIKSCLYKAYKFRIYPNKEQEELFSKTFGCVRFVYNYYLEKKIKAWQEHNLSLTYQDMAKDLVSYKGEMLFLKEVDSIALQQSLRHLDRSYQNFFRDKNIGFPKFKSKHKDRRSYTTICINNNIRIEGKHIVLPKLGRIKIKQHRTIPPGYQLKSCTVSQSAGGNYYVSILFEYEQEVEPVTVKSVVGLDFSMSELYVSSEGEHAGYPRYYRRSLEKLKRMQRNQSKMEKYSNNYNKQKRKIAKLHEKTANQRKDFLHKKSRQITNAFDLVAIEDLNMKAMQKALNFGKSVNDNAWGIFVSFLQYKLAKQGKKLVRIDKWFPSSKTCSVCGAKKEELSLSERVYICDCGNILDRDINAAVNIKTEAMRMLSMA